jgi:hypothetical protein
MLVVLAVAEAVVQDHPVVLVEQVEEAMAIPPKEAAAPAAPQTEVVVAVAVVLAVAVVMD